MKQTMETFDHRSSYLTFWISYSNTSYHLQKATKRTFEFDVFCYTLDFWLLHSKIFIKGLEAELIAWLVNDLLTLYRSVIMH